MSKNIQILSLRLFRRICKSLDVFHSGQLAANWRIETEATRMRSIKNANSLRFFIEIFWLLSCYNTENLRLSCFIKVVILQGGMTKNLLNN